MKKLLLFLSLLFIMSLSVFAGETFKCRKETFFYDIEDRTSSNEFLFINNFMIFPHDGYYRKYIFFIKDDKTGGYEAFGKYYPSYLGNGEFSGAAYGVGDPPRVKDKKNRRNIIQQNRFLSDPCRRVLQMVSPKKSFQFRF